MSVPYQRISIDDELETRYYWQGLSEGDVGAPVRSRGQADATVQLLGAFAGGYGDIEGTLLDDPAEDEWFTLHHGGDESQELTFGAAGGSSILENVLQIRPKIYGGAGMSVDVHILFKGKR